MYWKHAGLPLFQSNQQQLADWHKPDHNGRGRGRRDLRSKDEQFFLPLERLFDRRQTEFHDLECEQPGTIQSQRLRRRQWNERRDFQRRQHAASADDNLFNRHCRRMSDIPDVRLRKHDSAVLAFDVLDIQR